MVWRGCAYKSDTTRREKREESVKPVYKSPMEPPPPPPTKGPWTEQEDLQLVWFVRLLGERRWDFLAKVSGLNRSGKSCRLRWVNYLHPGLKRGRMTPQEEDLVVELHAKWGNRWSRIARRLPGRTDNEIKNYWRTHMRKKAQERRTCSPSPSPSSSSSSNGPPSELRVGDSVAEGSAFTSGLEVTDDEVKGYTMDQIWNEIAASDSCNMECPPTSSPIWEDKSESLWRLDDEDLRISNPVSDLLL
ncbi:hypothetical protein OPV22_020460 [Ensete ventricosum]|uniref:Uncharacterized protein n=1 Tax=Ensete ventricosum TaxID=4639 RepID=A0AAV8QIY0_ENSVE|nr:hypothetical protein OPV22_020460 [Ensete ventricosum]